MLVSVSTESNSRAEPRDSCPDRLQLLASLIENDPGAVLAAALPAAVRATLPPVVTAYLEHDADLQGMLEIFYEDWTVLNRVLIHIGTEDNGNSSHLLGVTPATPAYCWWYAPALVIGQIFQDPTAGIGMTTEWVTATEAAMTAQFSTPVSVSASQPSYALGQTVSLVATVTSGGAPVTNATVDFTITKSTGAVVVARVRTGSKGTAAYRFRLKQQDPVGTYQAAVTVKRSGYAATTFTVR